MIRERVVRDYLSFPYQSPTLVQSWYKSRSIIREFFLEETAKRRGRPIHVLDVGCFLGECLHNLSQFAGDETMELWGLDLSEDKLAAVREIFKNHPNFHFHLGNAENFDLGTQFDVILFTETVEHLDHPEDTLRCIHRHLKNDGAVLMSTPNPRNRIKSLVPRSLQERTRVPAAPAGPEPSPPPVQHPSLHHDHVKEYTFPELRAMVERTGFVIDTARRGSLLYGGEWFDRHPMVWGAALWLDRILDALPGTLGFTWDFVVKLRKKNDTQSLISKTSPASSAARR